MSNEVKEAGRDFALVYRWLDDEDVVHSRLLVLITDVPEAVSLTQVKQTVGTVSKTILEGTRFFSEQHDEAEVNWSKGYKLVPSMDWDEPLAQRVDNLKERSLMTGMMEEYSGIQIVSPEKMGMFVYMEDGEFLILIPYNDFLDNLKGEKRITLRLPLELHALLANEAYRSVYSSLNSFCINTLAKAVNYDEENLERFESERRKPGRPKKVQDSE